jgi:hypothetical protein
MTVASLLKLWTDATGPVQSQSGSSVRFPKLAFLNIGRTTVSPKLNMPSISHNTPYEPCFDHVHEQIISAYGANLRTVSDLCMVSKMRTMLSDVM